mmetsp:Transcript_15424/g.22666  ORF Transcript_15424/g.22666 Transcript_15424/m.22666 type:complete len:80 (+) Transcript_15424:206-445(+)
MHIKPKTVPETTPNPDTIRQFSRQNSRAVWTFPGEIAADQMKGTDITAADEEEGYIALLLAALEGHLTCLSSQHKGHNS